MLASARRRAWRGGDCLFRVISRSRPQCRAGVFARRLGFAASQGLRDDASIVPYGRGARPCQGLQDTCGAKRQCTPPSAPCGASTSPCRGGFGGTAAYKTSPVRGCGVERRLRRRKLFLIRQTAVTPFIIACSAIESIGPPFAHRSGLCRFAATQRSQNASVLQHTQRDAGTANR